MNQNKIFASPRLVFSFLFFLATASIPASFALTTGSISGTVNDAQGIAVSGAQVTVKTTDGKVLKQITSGGAGEFEIFPVDFGDYSVDIVSSGYQPFHQQVHVASNGNAQVDVALQTAGTPAAAKEMTIEVKAKKNRVNGSAATSSKELSQETIRSLPEGDEVKLPKLLATTNPGIVQGPFGQTFIRGNHANIQYQIDGVQLPDSPSSTFGQAFSPRNIDHMEVITGGVPAEYGERLSAVVNIITKSGTEVPGGTAELGYGTYNTWTPEAMYSGSNSAGDFHYYLSGAYTKTDRGLDTPQPQSANNLTQGGKEAIHDFSDSNDEFLKLDWQLDNSDKLTFIAFNSYSFFQIPNFPTSFGPDSSIFNDNDQFGNAPLHYVPSDTDDTQAENNAYAQLVWKRTLDSHSYLQLAPYYKFSKLHVTNDPTNDLAAATLPVGEGQSDSSSFAANRSTNNFGLKGDYSNRLDTQNLLKIGFQVQASKSFGQISVLSQPGGTAVPVASSDNSDDVGDFESLYFQDDYQLTKKLTFNLGVRLDATQFHFSDIDTSDSWVQPRLGASYLLTETTKIHAFFGLLFQPAPVENLRDTFQQLAGGAVQLAPYDIKAEKDHYYEVGISQQVGDQVMNLNIYYKNAKNMLDDAQLLTTSIAQPYNYAQGYAYGVEYSLTGKITEEWSDYFNYSYEVAKGEGLSGGTFAAPETSTNYQYLDHVQLHTANAGLTYKRDRWWGSAQELYGSGLRTGPGNSLSLPSHFSTDASVGYDFSGATWLSKARLSFDVLNIFDNVYPLTIANGFNGSHYAAGREFFVRLAKDF